MGEGWYVGKRGGATGGSDLTRGGHAGTVSGELGQSVPVKKNCSGLHISPLVGGLAGTSGESPKPKPDRFFLDRWFIR